MSAARPPEGARSGGEAEGTRVHAARPPEGARSGGEAEGTRVRAARPPEGARSEGEAEGTPVTDADAPTRQDAIYATLRQWVTVGRFQPGERLKIRQLAERLGSGLMPVRAALQRLAAEGALLNVPNAGVAVPRLSLAEFDDLLQIRMLLEGEAAERGALRLDAAGVRALQALGTRMGAALARHDADDYLAANEDFHVQLYRAAGSPQLFRLIETLWLKAGPVSNRLFEAQDAAAVLNEAHDAALAALARHDPGGVRSAIERDLFVAGQFIRRRLRTSRGG